MVLFLFGDKNCIQRLPLNLLIHCPSFLLYFLLPFLNIVLMVLSVLFKIRDRLVPPIFTLLQPFLQNIYLFIQDFFGFYIGFKLALNLV